MQASRRMCMRYFLALFVVLLGETSTWASDGRLVVVPKPGQVALSQNELNSLRMGIMVRWFLYRKISIKQPDGQMLEYQQPSVTQSRFLNAPINEKSSFSLGGDLYVDLHPTRWEQATQRFSMVAELRREGDREQGVEPGNLSVILSGLLQDAPASTPALTSSANGKTQLTSQMFVGEKRFAFSDVRGDLIAEFAFGNLPEVDDVPEPIARQDVP